MHPGKIYLALPLYSDVDPVFLAHAITWAREGAFDEIGYQIGCSIIQEARNELVAMFLASSCDRLVFCDSDQLPTSQQIRRLASHEEPVVAGFSQLKMLGPVRYAADLGPLTMPTRPDGLQELRYIGAGFMMIQRAVFQRMIDAWGNAITYEAYGGPSGCLRHNFFPQGFYKDHAGIMRLLPEDWAFCHRCHELGIKVFGDMTLSIPHRGPVNFPLASTHYIVKENYAR